MSRSPNGDGRSATERLADYAGAFRSEELGTGWTFAARGDTLVFRAGRDGTRLRAAGPDAFTDGYLLVVFTRDARGRPGAFTVSTPRAPGVRFERRP